MKKKPTWRGAEWRNDAAKFCKESATKFPKRATLIAQVHHNTNPVAGTMYYWDNLPRRYIPKMRRLLLRALLELDK
jgi:hypothetical protein